MINLHNNTQKSYSLSSDQKKAIWQKAKLVTGHEPNEWRRDNYGNQMRWEDYDNRKSNYGWEIAHINLIPNSLFNKSNNLQPIHWKNNNTN